MRHEVGRHRRHRREEAREHALVGADERVRRVGHVEVHRPVVRVHRDLDAVADVVEVGAAECRARQAARVERLRVREAVAGRVRVLDVDQPAGAVDDEVRILVVAQERRDPLEAIGQGAVEEELAAPGDLVADEQVDVAESQGEQQPAEGRIDVDAAGRPGPARGLACRAVVVLAGRVVELVLLRADHDVVARPLAEVDPGLGDRRGAIARDRRHVADEQLWLALVGDLVDGHHGEAVPVRVDDPLVHPAAGVGHLVQRAAPGRSA